MKKIESTMFEVLLMAFSLLLFVHKMYLIFLESVEKVEEGMEEKVGKRKLCSGFDDCDEPSKKKFRAENLHLFRVNIFIDPEFDSDDGLDDISSSEGEYDFDDLNSEAIGYMNHDPSSSDIDEFIREHASRFVRARPNEMPMDTVSISSDSIISVSSDPTDSTSSGSIISLSSDEGLDNDFPYGPIRRE